MKKIAVFGAGTMGAGIAQTYAMQDYEVFLYSRTQKTLDRARQVIEAGVALFAEEGLIEEENARRTAERLHYTTCVEEAAQGAWYVAETIAEREEEKRALYQTLDRLLPDEAILASNTSYLNIFQLVPEGRQERTVIAHWIAPAHIVPLVEVVCGPKTSEETMDRVMQLHTRCGKLPVRMERYVPGFIINRLQSAMTREVLYLLEQGYCTPETLDLAVKASLMPRGLLLGVVQRMDFNGLDVVAHGLENQTYTPAPAPEEDNIIARHYRAGELGVKSGTGFYDYRGRSYQEVLEGRDRQLIQSVRLARAFLDHPLADPLKNEEHRA